MTENQEKPNRRKEIIGSAIGAVAALLILAASIWSDCAPLQTVVDVIESQTEQIQEEKENE